MNKELEQALKEIQDTEFWEKGDPNDLLVKVSEAGDLAMAISPGDQVAVAVHQDDWMDEETMMEIQGWIFAQIWKDSLGFGDLDAVSWEVQFGNNFHGMPEDPTLRSLAVSLGIDPEDDQEVDLDWISVSLTDSAS